MDSYDHILARLSRFDEDLNRSRQGVQSTKKTYTLIQRLIGRA